MKKIIRLGDLALKIGSGQTPAGGEAAYQKQGIPLIRSQNVLMGQFSYGGLAYISSNQDLTMAGSRVLSGDVLLNITGASIGRVCISPEEICPANVNQHVCIIRCSENLMPAYLMYFLASPDFQSFIWESQAGGTRQALTKQMIEEFKIPLLTLDTQRRIVALLKTQLAEVEAARQAAQAQLDDADQLIQSLLKEAFSGLRELARIKISDFANTCSGTTPSRGRKDYWSPAKYPWVKTGEVAFEPIHGAEEFISEQALKECSLSVLPPKTVLVAMYGQGKTRGQSALLEVAATTNQACFAILPGERVDSEYLQFWLRRSYQTLRELSEARGGNQSNLNGEMMNAFEVPVPDLGRQKEIAAHLKASIHAAQQLRQPIEQQLQNIKQLPARLLAQAFES